MNCQQKSGVFLNIHCSNTKKNNCSNCNKDICETHSHTLKSKLYCEDCYWECFLYTNEYLRNYDTFEESSRGTNSTSYSSSSSNTNSNDSGFSGGFGGGEFGGGGASGEWTEGDMQSLNDTGNSGELPLDTAGDTFFYS